MSRLAALGPLALPFVCGWLVLFAAQPALAALPFPDFNPIALSLGPVKIHWYAISYLAGFVLGAWWAGRLARGNDWRPRPGDVGDFLTYAILGVLLGGRIGYLLFYIATSSAARDIYFEAPWRVFYLWEGGMSFHGGFVGVAVAALLYARAQKFKALALGDLVVCAAPLGLFFGRIANFVNGELYGRPADVPWAVIFPKDAAQLPRHPSQLYQALMEGLVLFVLLNLLARSRSRRERVGELTGWFVAGYGVARIVGELFREPDAQLGFLFDVGATMGQLLSVPMVLVGVGLIFWARGNRIGPADRLPAPAPVPASASAEPPVATDAPAP